MQLPNNKLTVSLLIKLSLPPLFVLAFIALFLLFYFNISIDGYITSQKPLFIFINQGLAAYQIVQLNLTQLGGALVLFLFITLFIKRYPTFCASLFVAAPLASLSPIIGKTVFAMPRAAIKNTTPLLSRLDNLYHYHTNACATYTTQNLRCY